MSIFLKTSNGSTTKAETFQFSGGELQTKIDEALQWNNNSLTIIARLQSPKDIIELLLVCEILKRFRKKATLVLPYLPYARQDRVMHQNEAFSLKVFSRLINSLSFDRVVTFDVHSDVSVALINNIKNIAQADLIKKYNKSLDDWIMQPEKPLIVSPDAGAYKKALKVAEAYGREVIIGNKTRNISTGAITDINIYGDVKGKDLLIVDDICDGGRTFIELAKVLRFNGAKSIALYVTHGIFSKGYEVFKGLIDRIYTNDTFIPESYPLPETDCVPLFINKLPYEVF